MRLLSWVKKALGRSAKPVEGPPPAVEDVLKSWMDTMRTWCEEDCSPKDIASALPIYAGFMALQCATLANEAWEQDPRRQHRNKQLVTLYQPVYRALHQQSRPNQASSVPALVTYMIETSGGNELERWSRASRERVSALSSRRP